MFQHTVPIKKSYISLGEKRDIMWNVLQPGDPYDIRKSMIAKLPGQKKPMAAHLELVCLLQAAQIQRLCQFLQQYKSKFRQFQRVGLDRHSYQIQIKQLTEKLAQQQNYRQQIQKLKQFIRKLSIELQQQKQGRQKNEELMKKYQFSLRQLEILIQENKQLKASIEKLEYDCSHLRFSEKNHSEEIQNLRQELKRQKDRYKKLENNSRQRASKWEEERLLLQRQLELLKKSFEDRGMLVDQVQRKNRNISSELEKYKAEYLKFIQLQNTISEYQNRFGILATQIDRLNGILRQKSRQLSEQYERSKHMKQVIKEKDEQLAYLQKQLRQVEQARSILQKQKRQILISLGDIQRNKILIHSYQLNLQKFSTEVDRLNNVLRKKVNELEQLKKKNNQNQIKIRQYEISQRQNSEYKIRYSQISKKINEYQKKNGELFQQNSQLNLSLRKIIQELNVSQLKLNNKDKEIQNNLRNFNNLRSELQTQKRNNNKLNGECQNYVHEIESLNYSIETLKLNLSREAENRKGLQQEVNRYADEIKNLNYTLSRRGQEIQSYRKSLGQNNMVIKKIDSITENNQQYIESLINKLRQTEFKLSQSQATIKDLTKQNHQFKNSRLKTNDIQAINTKRSEKYEEEIRILNKFLKNKDEEIQILKKQIFELQNTKKMNINNSFSPEKSRQTYENTAEFDSLDKRTDFIQKMKILQEEIAAKNGIIDGNNANIKELKMSIEELNRIIFENNQAYEIKTSQLLRQNKILLQKQKSTQYHQNEPNFIKLSQLAQTFPQFHDIYNQLFNDRQILFNDNIIFRSQIQKLNNELSLHFNNAQQLFNQNNELKRKLQDNINNKIQILGNQIQRLNEVIANQQQKYHKQDDLFVQKERNMQALVNLYKQQIQQLKANQNARPQLNQQQEYQSNSYSKISSLQYERDRLRQKVRQLQQKQKVRQLQQKQHPRPSIISNTGNISNSNDEKDNLLVKIRDYQRQLFKKQQLITSKITQNNNIAQTLSRITSQNTQLKRQMALLKLPNDKYQQKLSLSYQEIQRLNNVLKQKMQGIKASERDIEKMKSDYEKNIYELNFKYNEQIYRLQNQLSLLKKQKNIQQFGDKPLNQYQIKILELSTEIERLNKILFNNKQIIQEFQNNGNKYLREIERLSNTLKLKIEQQYIITSQRQSSRNQRQIMSAQLNNLRSQHESLLESHDILQKKSKQYEGFLKEYQKKISQMYLESERLQKILTATKIESEQAKNNNNFAKQLTQKNRYLAKEIERLNEIIRVLKIDLSDFKLKRSEQITTDRRIQQHLALFVVLFAQIESLRQLSDAQQRQIQEVRKEAIAQHSV